jgi:hypothetical protein
MAQRISASELAAAVPNLSRVLQLAEVEDAYGPLVAPTEEIQHILAPAQSATADAVAAIADAARASADGRIHITIITGIPGSGKARVCSSIVALAKEDFRWVTVKPDFATAPTFDPTRLQSQLRNVHLGQARSGGGSGGGGGGKGDKPLRVLLLTSGYTDIAEVVHAIHSHPEYEVARAFRIASIICCVDPANVFMQEVRATPQTLTLTLLCKTLPCSWILYGSPPSCLLNECSHLPPPAGYPPCILSSAGHLPCILPLHH